MSPRAGLPTAKEGMKRRLATEAKIREIIAEQLGLRIEEVRNEAHYLEDLGADSLDIVELVMAMEEEFELEIPDDDVEKMQTVQDTLDYVLDRMSA